MIEKETMLTVFGIILLGASFGLSSSYIMNKDADWRLTGSALPFAMNMSVLLYIAYGLFSVSKLSNTIKVYILLFFMIVSFVEIAMMYDKPTSSFGVATSWTIMAVSTLLRLYFIISLHCDLPKSLFVVAAKSILEPNKVQNIVSESKPEPDWNRSFQIFDSALNKTQLTPEEKAEQRNKFKIAWGKEPKEVVLKGGKRR